ncbi:hypothetical protein [Heyndrickxia sporothermodurans]|uniref:hypothetical protein n=1 Tax=Heyndrickxia sporothermodurans TaxID=46224 RepID=UPI000D3918E9|nr:hypothetical protein [Heyndrickxia sporothermodurans]PTY92863.1 hypothetical protein B5V90_01950 [Heyndrickxia sporothermodurans]
MAGGKFAGGTGTALDPFLIEDAHDFNAIRLYSSGYNFQLIKDVNMNQPPYNTGAGWQPIPNFNSKIDGQGHKVSGLRVWSKGDDVGIFLNSGSDMSLTNIHFDDLYLELDTLDTAAKKFTLFGTSMNNFNGAHNALNGVSIVGKFKAEAPNVTARLLMWQVSTSYNSGAYLAETFSDVYLELENIGSKRINVYGHATMGDTYRNSCGIQIVRNIVKLKGDFEEASKLNNAYVSVPDSYVVEEVGFNNPTSSFIPVRTVEFLSIPTNIVPFTNASQKGRQVWFFPGGTHVRMVDYSRNKFLIEANGEILSYSADQGLFRVGASPILTDMFTLYGMDYIESVPVSVWNELRQTYGTVDIHCYVEKIPGKTLVTNRETLAFNQALNNKVVMKAVIDFSLHNNDISKIRIPATDQAPVITEPAPTEPTDPGTTEPVTDPGTTEPTL